MTECRCPTCGGVPTSENLKSVLIALIVKQGFHGMGDAADMDRLGLAIYTGDQYNPAWMWDRKRLESMTVEELDGVLNREGGEYKASFEPMEW